MQDWLYGKRYASKKPIDVAADEEIENNQNYIDDVDVFKQAEANRTLSSQPAPVGGDGEMTDEEVLAKEVAEDEELEQTPFDAQLKADLEGPLSEESLKKTEKPIPTVEEVKATVPMNKLKELQDKLKKKTEEKKEGTDWWGRLPDLLAAAHNIDTYRHGVTGRKELPINYYEKQQAKKRAERTQDITDMTNLMKLQSAIRDFQNPDLNAKYKVAGNSIFKIAPGKEPEFVTKDPTAQTEAQKEFDKKEAAALSEALPVVEKATQKISMIDGLIPEYLELVRNATIPESAAKEKGTFGLLTSLDVGGRKRIASRMAKLDILDMVQTFSGMSKAIDSDAEQARWQKTVAALENGPEANLDVLVRGKEIALRYKAYLDAKEAWFRKTGSFLGFKPPKTEVLYSPKGKAVVIDSKYKNKYKDVGYMDLNKFSEHLYKNRNKLNYEGGVDFFPQKRNNEEFVKEQQAAKNERNVEKVMKAHGVSREKAMEELKKQGLWLGNKE